MVAQAIAPRAWRGSGAALGACSGPVVVDVVELEIPAVARGIGQVPRPVAAHGEVHDGGRVGPVPGAPERGVPLERPRVDLRAVDVPGDGAGRVVVAGREIGR